MRVQAAQSIIEGNEDGLGREWGALAHMSDYLGQVDGGVAMPGQPVQMRGKVLRACGIRISIARQDFVADVVVAQHQEGFFIDQGLCPQSLRDAQTCKENDQG